jgi:putative sugar O-methyltransferase
VNLISNSRVANLSLKKVFDRVTEVFYPLASIAGKKTKLSVEQIDLLEKMRLDNACAPSPFRTSSRWAEIVKSFEKEFFFSGIGDVETDFYNLRFSGFSPSDPRIYGYFVYTLYQLVRQRDIYGLLEKIPATTTLQDGFAYKINGQKVSLDLLLSIDDFYNLLEIRPNLISEPIIVADIGAGWGRLGYVLKKANPLITYLVFDLPEILLISSTYLPRVLPNIRYQMYEESRFIKLLDRETLTRGGMWFLGTQDLMKTEDASLDIVVNIASFQEMTLEQVSQYFNLITRKAQNGQIYLEQLWSGKTMGQHLDEIEDYNKYPFPKSWEQIYLRNSSFSQTFFETAFNIT